MLPWIVAGSLLSLLVMALARDPASPTLRKPRRRPEPPNEQAEDPIELLTQDAPAALLRYGTPQDVEYLKATGRGDDLHGLGYRD